MIEHLFQRQLQHVLHLRQQSRTQQTQQPQRPPRPARHDPEWHPRITAFFCNSQADPDSPPLPAVPGLEIVHMRCAGRNDPQALLQAFHDGADGVLMAACGPERCQRAADGARSVFMQRITTRLLSSLQIRPGRVRLAWIDPQDAGAALRTIESFSATLRAFGPLDLPGREAALEEEVEKEVEVPV